MQLVHFRGDQGIRVPITVASVSQGVADKICRITGHMVQGSRTSGRLEFKLTPLPLVKRAPAVRSPVLEAGRPPGPKGRGSQAPAFMACHDPLRLYCAA